MFFFCFFFGLQTNKGTGADGAPMTGRYINFVKPTFGFVQLCEVQVRGKPVRIPASAPYRTYPAPLPNEFPRWAEDPLPADLHEVGVVSFHPTSQLFPQLIIFLFKSKKKVFPRIHSHESLFTNGMDKMVQYFNFQNALSSL